MAQEQGEEKKNAYMQYWYRYELLGPEHEIARLKLKYGTNNWTGKRKDGQSSITGQLSVLYGTEIEECNTRAKHNTGRKNLKYSKEQDK
jgi:hypothetical protein